MTVEVVPGDRSFWFRLREFKAARVSKPPVEAVEPLSTREALIMLMNVARDRVSDADKSGDGREVFLRKYERKILVRVRNDRLVDGKSAGDLSTGLYIYGLSTDKSIDVEDRGFYFMLPREVSAFTPERLEALSRGFSPEAVKRLADTIYIAGVCGKITFYQEHNKYLDKLREARLAGATGVGLVAA